MSEGIVLSVLSQLSSAAANEIGSSLGSFALKEFGSAMCVTKEIRRLHQTLTAINEFLPHAENLQLSNNNVKSWLRRIKDAAYDAEDIIDDFATETTLRDKLMAQGSIIERVCHFASSSNPILLRIITAHKIKQVREDLKDIYDDHQSFGLERRDQENYDFISMGRQTHSFIPEGKVVGRDLEREELVKLLLDTSGRDSLSVIPIQGMGGIGKTALAQLVYNDKRVIDSFEHRMWVCVSDEFDVKKIVEMIIESVTNKKCPNRDMDQLPSVLRRHLGGKRYLLVLDDIWNEEFDEWEELRYLLTGGASGSKIVVTTRSERVGSIMGTIVVQRLSELSEGDCWNLFKGRAFKEGEEEAYPELVEIGKDIAKKCAGVPLAAKILGGLCYPAKKEKWELVRDSDVWRLPEYKNGILHTLLISYNHLSVYLKQCFAYCSIFPKDFEIHKDVLIQLWIAQGFISSFGNNRSLEDIGKEYVEVLMWRSFFQEPKVDVCNNLLKFKMHDLVHDLAQYVAGVECFTVCDDNEENFPEGVRHLFFNIEGVSSPLETPTKIPEPSNIRTLVFASKIDFFVGTIFSSLKFLRVFQFRDDYIDNLPNSIDKLKHLRYLQIECPEIKRLPDSITNLQNLQVFNLRCDKLEKLPDKIGNMISLKHIDFLQDSLFDKPMPFLSHMPVGLEKLRSLQTLSDFIVSKGKSGCELNELNALTSLGGKLKIWNLENVKNANEIEQTILKTKRNLQRLMLHWGEEFVRDISSESISFEVLSNLEPHSNLKILQIKGYAGTRFPRWSLQNVVEIILHGCIKCEHPFPFSRLPSLKVLKLRDMDAVKCIEGTPEQSEKEWFPSLRELFIRGCPNLESWFPMQSQQQLQISFPSLVHLSIFNCPKLKNMPLLLPSIIKMLDLWRSSGELVHSVLREGNSSLETLCIYECEGMESWPNWLGPQLTSLRKLVIGCSPSLPFLPQQIECITALQILVIRDYCEEALPEWIGNFTSL